MPPLPPTGVARVPRLRTPAEEGGSWTREIPSHTFETTERGVVLGSLVIPWHRVQEYRQIDYLTPRGAWVELRERQVAGLRLGAEVHAAGGDQVDAFRVAPGDEDFVTRRELVELGERFEAVAVPAVELLEALAGREGEHGPPGRLPSCLIPDRAARRQRASRNPMFE